MAIRIKLQYFCFVAPNILAPIAAYILLTFYQIKVDSNSDGLLNYGFIITKSNVPYESSYNLVQAGFVVTGIC